MEVSREVADLITQATREWTWHVLCECDPDTCDGDHDERWWLRRAEHEQEQARQAQLRQRWASRAGS